MINFIHSLYIRISNKIKRLKKKNSWNTIPHLKDNVFFKDGIQLYDPHLIGVQTLGDQCKHADTAQCVLKILEELESEPSINFVKDFISKEFATFLYNYTLRKRQSKKTMIDRKILEPKNILGTIHDLQVEGAFCSYGDPAMETLQLGCMNKINKILFNLIFTSHDTAQCSTA